MDYVKFHRLSSISLLVIVTSFLLACGGGGGGKKETSKSSSSFSSVTASASSSVSSIPVVATTLTLGAPTSNPLITPPSPSLVPIKFLSVVRGSYYPDQLVLDEVDKNGALVQSGIALLKDDGNNADAFRGDRTYSTQVMLGGVASTEKFYRVRADHQGEEVTSGTGRFWVSGCPPIARPSNPEKIVFDPSSNANVFADEVLVTLADSIQPELGEINAIMADIQGHVVGCIPALRQYLVEVAGNTTVEELYIAINTLKEKTSVIDATPNAVVLSSPENDDLACDGLACQWYLDRIRAPQAWDLVGGGDEQMSVAVIDFGVDCHHPELNCDSGRSSEDAIDHGTGVAGLIAARKGDGSPMVGVAWNTELYPYSFIGSGGSQYKMSELIALSMAQESVRIINISAATATDPGNQIRDAMCSAIDSGRLIVAAAGNTKAVNQCQLENIYPARYNDVGECSNGADLAKGLVVVGAIDEDNNLAQWEGGALCSNTLHIDIFAPGKNIYTASVEASGYASKNGTSFSSPLVAGSAAILWASKPTLTVAEVHDALVNSAVLFNQETLDDRNQTTDQRLDGKRLLDVYKAVGGSDDLPSPDLIPNTFTFASRSNVELNTYINSSSVVITDIDAPIPIDISDGFYSIDNGPFTSAAGTISPNQSVIVQLLSASQPSALREATLTIGGLSRVFRVTTAATVIAQPDDFDFLDVQQADLGAVVLSNALHISGINSATPISIQGGEYAIGQGEFTSASGSVDSEQDIQIRVTAANIPDTAVIAIITIGGVSDSFRVTTKPADITPAPFAFTDSIGVSTNTQIETNIITVQGINTTAAISVSGGEYSIDGGPYRTAAGSIQQGQTVQLRHNSANNFSADSFTTLTVGTYSATFRSRTITNSAPVASNINIVDSNGGNLVVGDNLIGSYNYSDADNDSEGASKFRWLRNGNPINGATATTYTLTLADSDQSITFEVTPIATTGLLSGVAAMSSSITITNSAPIVKNILVTDINGAALLVGDILDVTYDFFDVDNDAEGNTTYRWLRNGVEIFGATSSSYQVVSDDVGQSLTVEIIPVALTGQLVGTATLSTPVIVGNTAPQASGVSISGHIGGTSVIGANLTGIYTFTDVDNDSEGTSLYQWFRNGVAIGGATALSYQITAVDSGQTIAFEVTPVAATGTVQGTSIRSGDISINAIPVAQSVAIVDNNGGNLLVGDSLTGTYSYNDAESDAQGASVYRWLRNGSPINGATSTNYVLISADSGQSIRFEVTPVAISGSATGTAVLSSAVAVNNSAPLASNVTITDSNGGGLALGDVLAGSYVYNDNDGDSEGATTFRWLRNGSQVVSTAQNYALTASDGGQSIAFEVVPRAVMGATNGAAVTSSALPIPLYTPNAFSFTPVTGAELSAEVVSNAVNISGINTAVPISIVNGQYSINGGAFTSAASTVTNGQSVIVKVIASAAFNTTTQAALTVGGVVGDFSVTTVPVDTTPDAFNFAPVTNAVFSMPVTSNVVTISGINTAVPISITNGKYAIDTGAFTSVVGTVSSGQTVKVQVIGAPSGSTQVKAVLTVGSSSGEFAVTTMEAESTPPAAAVMFPSQSAMTDRSSVVVRGTASDSSGIGSINVNGMPAVYDDAMRSWQANVPLNLGDNTLTLTVADTQNNKTIRSISVRNSPLGDNLYKVRMDAAHNRLVALNMESQLGQLVTVDRTSGEVNVVPGGGTSNPRDMRVSLDGTRALVLESPNNIDAIKEINLLTGERKTIAQDSSVEPEGTYRYMYDIALDSVNKRLFVTGSKGLIQVDLTEGVRSQVYDIINLWGLAWDAVNSRVIMAASNGELVEFKPEGATSKVLSNNSIAVSSSNVGFGSLSGLVLDEQNNMAYVASYTSGKGIAIIEVNLATGSRRLVSDNTMVGAESFGNGYSYLALDKANNQLLVSKQGDGILGVDITSGARTRIMSGISITGIKFVPATNTVIAVGQDKLFSFVLGQTTPTIVSDNTMAVVESDTKFVSGFSLALDSVTNLAYVGDSQTASVFTVNLQAGRRNTVTDNSQTGSDNTLIDPRAILWQEAENRVLVLDTGRRSILEINTVSTARSVFSSPFFPSNSNVLSRPVDMLLSPLSGEVLVLDKSLPGVVSVSPVSGARNIYGGFTQDSRTPYITSMAFNNSDNSVLFPNFFYELSRLKNNLSYEKLVHSDLLQVLYDGDANSVVALEVKQTPGVVGGDTVDLLHPMTELVRLNLNTNIRTALPVAPTASGETSLTEPVDVAVDSAANFSYVVDAGAKAIVRVSLLDGKRTLFADNAIASGASNINFVTLSGIDLDLAHNRLIVGDANQHVLIAVDLTTATRTLLTSDSVAVTTSNVSIRPSHLAVDSLGEFAYMFSNSIQGIARVDLASGERRLLSDNAIAVATSNVQFSSLVDIVLDEARNRLLVADAGPDSVIAVDLETGARTELTSGSTGLYPDVLAVDKSSNQVLVFDIFHNQLHAIDLVTGVVRNIVKSGVLLNKNNMGGMDYNSANNTLVMAERDRNAVLAVDIKTGEGVVLSQ